jgi:5-methylcytosine-specific restriction endonuclease McrA
VLRTANKRYRARKRDAYVEDVNALVVAERDGWICRLRKTNIQVTRKHDNKDPWCLEIDHIVPVSRGGEESYANTQCAHRRCNQIKSNGEFSFDRLLKLCAADIEKEL